MEKECLIIGKVNVGKTLFMLSFAQFLGLKELEVNFCYPNGLTKNRNFSPSQAKKILIDSHPHKTRCLQKITLFLPAGKGKKKIVMIDSSGVIEGIHEEREIRLGIAQSLLAIQQSHLILHVIDVSSLRTVEDIGEIDTQIAEFSQLRGGYAILANKIDQENAQFGLDILDYKFPNVKIMPISAKQKQGFKEVKTFVSRNI